MNTRECRLEFVAKFSAIATLAVTLALTAAPAAADMYVWKDPQTGRTRMSNIPPPWLRDPQPGQRVPKVEVVRERKVIDVQAAFATPQEAAKPSEKQMAMGRRAPPPVVIAPAAAPAKEDDD